MSEVNGNIGPWLGEDWMDWIKVSAARCEKCGLVKRIEVKVG